VSPLRWSLQLVYMREIQNLWTSGFCIEWEGTVCIHTEGTSHTQPKSTYSVTHTSILHSRLKVKVKQR
jgi:hypothetical protein